MYLAAQLLNVEAKARKHEERWSHSLHHSVRLTPSDRTDSQGTSTDAEAGNPDAEPPSTVAPFRVSRHVSECCSDTRT